MSEKQPGHPDARRWKTLLYVRCGFALVYLARVAWLAAGSDRTPGENTFLVGLWLLPLLVYLFAIRSLIASVALGALLVATVYLWIGDTWKEFAFSEFSQFGPHADGLILFITMVAGVLIDLVILGLTRGWRAMRRPVERAGPRRSEPL